MTATADTTTSYDEELSTCPECDGLLRLVDGIESTGEGIAFGYDECSNWGFRAREEWVHDQTVRTDDQDAPRATAPPSHGRTAPSRSTSSSHSV